MKRHWVEFRLPTSDACPADMNALGGDADGGYRSRHEKNLM
ncbi:hypothetical protein [uncultured Bacteroides sp.]|nr:hypothetical protein [uncultured Bacteroides sp.]